MPENVQNVDVLIVGAGPTGLVMALWLARSGVGVRVIDRTSAPGTSSRALVVHARTLELYRQLGIADEVLSRALPFSAVNLWVRGRRVARAELGALGRGVTPYPELVICPQDQHERLLIERLRDAGVEVDRATELTGFEAGAERVVVRTRRDAGDETESACAYLAGCDGAHSRVREVLGVGFAGGTYERVFYVADVEVRGPATDADVKELHIALDDADFLALFPLVGDHAARLIGAVRPHADERINAIRARTQALTSSLSWDDVSAKAIEHMNLDVQRVNWFSTYHVHHRVAERFRRGRVFLAGDAAHVHSPVGGQGMNTGIGDAVNLAWKLADVLHGRATAPDAFVDTYEAERIGFARRLVATTDRAFTLVSRDGWLARWMRMRVVPRLLPPLVRRTAVRRFLFRTISQTAISYRGSALSRGKAGKVRGGQRLPWVASADNYAPTERLEWQVHVYGDASAELRRVEHEWTIPVRVFPWSAEAKAAGLARDHAYLVRPDGHVALAAARGRDVQAYLVSQRGHRPTAWEDATENPPRASKRAPRRTPAVP